MACERVEWKRGATREVLLIGRYAFKVPTPRNWRMFVSGLLANMNEVEWGRSGYPDLCPVLAYLPGGWLVVMERCECAGYEFTRGMGALRRRQRRVMQVDRIEAKESSFGYLNGRLVAVDYG